MPHHLHREWTKDKFFGRFEVLAELGAGGYGQVLRVYDHVVGADRALKLLYRQEGDALIRFKKEFRSLADVRHPNLVELGELYEDQGRWGFSMELISGIQIRNWARPDQLREDRVRHSVRQLVEGLDALHSEGMTHRDVKPENVLVTPAGRVVLLDFGMVSRLAATVEETATAGAGTIAFMAPEQAENAPLDEKADLYAVGVILYEMLTGRLPFEGDATAVLMAKSDESYTPVLDVAPSAPVDLARLCQRLLHKNPAARPDSAHILRQLGGTPSRLPPDSTPIFVGRVADQTAVLKYLGTRREKLALVVLEGDSGIGKTALMQRCLEAARAERPDTLVLPGRCHVAEQVRFKAIDGAMDAAAQFLANLPDEQQACLLETDIPHLTRLFPALRKVSALRRFPKGLPTVDRHRLFLAIGQLLERLSRHAPVLLTIDDLQWADPDSLAALQAILRAPVLPPVQFLMTARTGHEAVELIAGAAPAGALLRVPLCGLSDEDSQELCSRLMPAGSRKTFSRQIAAASLGHPLFIAELSRHAQSATDDSGGQVVELHAALARRIGQLSQNDQDVLHMVAVAGRPISQRLLIAAERLAPQHAQSVIDRLRRARLLDVLSEARTVCYHDRIRAVVLELRSATETADAHRRLALAIEAQPELSAADLAEHWQQAGEPERAVPYLEQAAAEAFEAAAFETACRVLTALLAVGGRDHANDYRLLGDALAAAGRRSEAANAYLKAGACGGDPDGQLEQLAAQQLLEGGELEEGFARARSAFGRVHLSMAHRDYDALVRLIWHRSAIALKSHGGLGSASPEQLRQLDTLWRFAQPLVWVDLLAGAEVMARHHKLALEFGDTRHQVLAACAEATILGMQNVRNAERARSYVKRAQHLYETLENPGPDARGQLALHAATIDSWISRYASAEQGFARAARIFREHCPSDSWSLSNAQSALLATRFFMGNYARAAEDASNWIANAAARGDRFAEVSCAVLGFGYCRHLMADRLDDAWAEVERTMRPWRRKHMGMQTWGEMLARHFLLSYRGQGEAHAYWKRTHSGLRRSFMGRTQFVQETANIYRALANLEALALADPSRRTRCLAESRRAARKLARSSTALARASFSLVASQLAWAEGNRSLAQTHAELAGERFTAMGHLCHVLVPAWRAWLADDAEGSEVRRVLGHLREQGWQDPLRWLRVWIPMFGRS